MFLLITVVALSSIQERPEAAEFEIWKQIIADEKQSFEAARQQHEAMLDAEIEWIARQVTLKGVERRRLQVAAKGVLTRSFGKASGTLRGIERDFKPGVAGSAITGKLHDARRAIPQPYSTLRSNLWHKTLGEVLGRYRLQTVQERRADRLVAQRLTELNPLELSESQSRSLRHSYVRWLKDVDLTSTPEPLIMWRKKPLGILLKLLTPDQQGKLKSLGTMWQNEKCMSAPDSDPIQGILISVRGTFFTERVAGNPMLRCERQLDNVIMQNARFEIIQILSTALGDVHAYAGTVRFPTACADVKFRLYFAALGVQSRDLVLFKHRAVKPRAKTEE